MKIMRILIAPNAFKHSLNATDASLAIREGLTQSHLDCRCTCFPVGDGGDGTGNLLIEKLAGNGFPATGTDPFGRPITSSFGLVNNGTTAIIELASASGLHRLASSELNPLHATSFGTGELIRQALDKGVSEIILAIGGSATVDGGTGILRALGVRFLDRAGSELITPEHLVALDSIDTSNLDQRIRSCAITILCDVNNTLLGNEGAAAVFGPQKGATPDAVKKLETSLTALASVTQRQTGLDIATVKHGGAAGGVAAGLHAWLHASLTNGIDSFLTLTNFDQLVAVSDLVITGEGSIDEQTLQGKGPVGVARRAKKYNVPVIGLAGKIPREPNKQLSQYFDVLMAIGSGPEDMLTARRYTEQNLQRTACQIGNLLLAANRAG